MNRTYTIHLWWEWAIYRHIQIQVPLKVRFDCAAPCHAFSRVFYQYKVCLCIVLSLQRLLTPGQRHLKLQPLSCPICGQRVKDHKWIMKTLLKSGPKGKLELQDNLKTLHCYFLNCFIIFVGCWWPKYSWIPACGQTCRVRGAALGSDLCLSNQQASTITALWESLDKGDKQRVHVRCE